MLMLMRYRFGLDETNYAVLEGKWDVRFALHAGTRTHIHALQVARCPRYLLSHYPLKNIRTL